MKQPKIIFGFLSSACCLLFSALCFLPSLPCIAEETEDIFSGLKKGDRIEITLKNDNTFRGEITVFNKDRITIDITYDEPELGKQLTFSKKEIKEIEVLSALSNKEKEDILKKRKEDLPEEQEEAARLKTEEPPQSTPETPKAPEKTPEEQEKERLMKLLERFPPDKGWDEAKYEELVKKDSLFQKEEEKVFLASYQDWKKAVEMKGRADRRALLEKYLPEDGWNKAKAQEISTRFVRRKVSPTPEELEFAAKFADWEKALAEREEEKKLEGQKKKEQSEKEEKESPPLPPPESERPEE